MERISFRKDKREKIGNRGVSSYGIILNIKYCDIFENTGIRAPHGTAAD